MAVAGLLERHKVLVGSSVCLLVFYLLIAVFWIPQQEKMIALRTELSNVRQAVLAVESHGIAHPDGKQYLAELDKQLLLVDQLLPDKADIGTFIVETEKNARISGVQIIEIIPNQLNQKTEYHEISVTMTIKGSYFQMLDFFHRLEGMQRFSSVTAVAVQAKSGLIEGKNTIQVYAYGLASVAAPGVQR